MGFVRDVANEELGEQKWAHTGRQMHVRGYPLIFAGGEDHSGVGERLRAQRRLSKALNHAVGTITSPACMRHLPGLLNANQRCREVAPLPADEVGVTRVPAMPRATALSQIGGFARTAPTDVQRDRAPVHGGTVRQTPATRILDREP